MGRVEEGGEQNKLSIYKVKVFCLPWWEKLMDAKSLINKKLAELCCLLCGERAAAKALKTEEEPRRAKEKQRMLGIT